MLSRNSENSFRMLRPRDLRSFMTGDVSVSDLLCTHKVMKFHMSVGNRHWCPVVYSSAGNRCSWILFYTVEFLSCLK